jgi:hypothetical protein
MTSSRTLGFARLCGLGLCAFSLCGARSAHANGRFPAASQLVVDRTDPNHLFVSATYGLLVSVDAGREWSWICESAYGSTGTEDAAVAIMNGTLLAGLYSGLSVSKDGSGCNFAWASGPLAKETVVDVAIDKATPSHAVAVTSTAIVGDGSFTFDNVLTESLDDGASFHLAGVALPDDLEVLTVDTAPSDAQRVYVSGTSVASSQNGIIERSDDRGAHWARIAVAESPPGSLPFIAAVDPNHADTLYVRVTQGTEALLVSTNGAGSWRPIFSATSPILGFALSPDSSKIAVGTATGIAIASTSDYAFQQVNSLIPTCLTWSDAGIYACAKESTTGFSIGLSEDEAATFHALYHLNGYCGPTCPSGTATARACQPMPVGCDAGSEGGADAGNDAAGAADATDAGNVEGGRTSGGASSGGSSHVGGSNDAGTNAGTTSIGRVVPVQTKSSAASCGCRIVGSARDWRDAIAWTTVMLSCLLLSNRRRFHRATTSPADSRCQRG